MEQNTTQATNTEERQDEKGDEPFTYVMTYPYIPNPDSSSNNRVNEIEPEFEGLLSDEDLDIINRK